MARGKIISDPIEYFKKKLDKYNKDYNQSISTAQREHLLDKIRIYETALYGAEHEAELNDYRKLLREYQKKYGKTVQEAVYGS